MKEVIDINTCSECGAELTSGRSCQDSFDALLAKEYSNTEYGAVHHVSVPAYMLQHPSRLSRRGWLEMRRLLSSFITQGKSPNEVRKTTQKSVQNNQRDFSFTKGESIKLGHMNWTKTISDIRMEEASTYCEDVLEWAHQILKDTEKFETMNTS
jgi:hypothetical protein